MASMEKPQDKREKRQDDRIAATVDWGPVQCLWPCHGLRLVTQRRENYISRHLKLTAQFCVMSLAESSVFVVRGYLAYPA
ncbi:hypothetical protein ACRE_072570 [Hapsidospora chrysogenum ATCC 11550]|uniref:Uncharacterized protein n=1 Tax=Hapsidospora chrysogenum (strain ATCC 11550 / CBS 779.69 / DSM 880 / IAM 14645 / JCM 23072 / IMI 49137) TaxID=857340 RepID=A0A086SY19_HAPC1|nr:hypothetical protein ACRE_072570 [Hapsidospora chrysogenum ATCC 11550]